MLPPVTATPLSEFRLRDGADKEFSTVAPRRRASTVADTDPGWDDAARAAEGG